MTSTAAKSGVTAGVGEAVLNALPHPVLVVSPDARVVEANIAAEAFFETSIAMLQRQSLREFVPFGSPCCR